MQEACFCLYWLSNVFFRIEFLIFLRVLGDRYLEFLIVGGLAVITFHYP